MHAAGGETHPKVWNVGVNQYVQQPILDAVMEGLRARLATEPNLRIEFKNAHGDVLTCQQINEQFVQAKVDVIVALGTPAAQSAVRVSPRIPVVFGAITDPVGAKLADSLDKPGANKTGTSNRWPFEDQITMIKRLMPNARKIGLVVNPSEANCEAGMKVIRAKAQEVGWTLLEVPVATSAEVRQAVESLKGRVDLIMVSPSNVVFSALDALLATSKEIGVPVLGGDESAVKRGSIATCGFSNTDVGLATAEVVLEVLKNDKPAGEIPVARPPAARLFLNEEAAAAFGLKLDATILGVKVAR
jgi:putative ABC transport system substrate-binding protein